MKTTTSTFSIDFDALTVIRTDENGERFDLNAHGEPCETLSDLKDFVDELHEQGGIDAATHHVLSEVVDSEM